MLSIIIVGINQWEQYTKKLVEQIRKHEPYVEIIMVDNGSAEPYPRCLTAIRVRIKETVCYSEAINRGVWASSSDWIMWMNNDISCTGKFASHVAAQKKDALYSRQIIEEAGHIWFGNWIGAVHKDVWNDVGEFDTNFKVCGFEDCDYSMRAYELGYETRPIELPFIHHWGRTRWEIPGYAATRDHNIDYFESKHRWKPGREMKVTHD